MKHVFSAQEEKLQAVEVSKTLKSANKVKNISQAYSILNMTLPCG